MEGEVYDLNILLSEVRSSSNLTETESYAAVGGLFGFLAGMLTTILIVSIIWYILVIISNWKIFTKAGEKGWKSIIPIYNLYILCKIVGMSFWKWFLIFLGISVLQGIGTAVNAGWLVTCSAIATFVAYLWYSIRMAINTGEAFGKGSGFKVLLFFFPEISKMVLGFGKSEYKGVPGGDSKAAASK